MHRSAFPIRPFSAGTCPPRDRDSHLSHCLRNTPRASSPLNTHTKPTYTCPLTSASSPHTTPTSCLNPPHKLICKHHLPCTIYLGSRSGVCLSTYLRFTLPSTQLLLLYSSPPLLLHHLATSFCLNFHLSRTSGPLSSWLLVISELSPTSTALPRTRSLSRTTSVTPTGATSTRSE